MGSRLGRNPVEDERFIANVGHGHVHGHPLRSNSLGGGTPGASTNSYSHHHSAQVVDSHLRPSLPPSASAPAGRLPRLLPHDTSQYTEAYLPTSAVPTSSTSLAELAHLIRLQRYQEQKRNHARVRLHRWLVSSALSARLLHVGELAHRTLVDNFKTDEKRHFATLFNAIHDVRSSCEATRQFALLEPDLELSKSTPSKFSRAAGSGDRIYQNSSSLASASSFSTFMHELPSSTRDEFLTFISEIRTNPDFLAARLTSLSQQELASLTSFRPTLDPIDSVMALQGGRSKGVGSSAQKPTPQVPNPVERLLSFQRHDPLSALIYTIFANSSGPDSAEDLRRTEAWSTACARLIVEAKPGSDKFIKIVLDAWTGMREWPGKANLELYLMQVLQEGQFILDKPDDQFLRSRGQADSRNSKDTIAADEFYERAVKRLFEVIDDEPSAGGIPDGVLELGTAIIHKLEDSSKRHQRIAQTFIVSRWFFSTFLLNAIIHPESHGIMTGYHISEHARQRILKEIALRAHKAVADMTYNWKQHGNVLPEIKTHIENILARFKSNRPHTKPPVLLPAKAITSPRETVEVQPFLVVCPADIYTLINALFPERRPPSSQLDKDLPQQLRQGGGLASGASSMSGASMPFRAPSSATLGANSASAGGDASSILSMSASSVTSDQTSREPLLEPAGRGGEPNGSLFPGSGEVGGNTTKVAPTEEYGRLLRMACSEMSRILGVEATSGTCHPCAERWSVLYVSPDGKELRTRMRKDFEDEDEELDEDSADTDSDEDDDGPAERMQLETDYHLLKENIAKLVEEYEIPKELAPESESKGFSNRTSTIRRDARLDASDSVGNRALPPAEEHAPFSEKPVSKNPYHSQSQLTNLLASTQKGTSSVGASSRHRSSSQHQSPQQHHHHARDEKQSVLITMLEAATQQCQARSDFVNAHLYFKTLQQLRRLSVPSLTRNGYASLLNYFSRGPRDSLSKSATAIEEFEAWFVWLKQSQERHDSTIEDMMLALKNLRDKMWYITDVRNSAVYDEAKNVAVALKVMGQPTKTADGRPIPGVHQQHQRHRNAPKPAASNYLLKTEVQVYDLMAASPDHGGPNKLSDEQSEITSGWLSQYGIENGFCKGEERIHRFCLEVDKCVNKLVAHGIMDGPVLWSSELYRRDKEILDSGRQKGDLFLTGVGTLSIAGDEEYETLPGLGGLGSGGANGGNNNASNNNNNNNNNNARPSSRKFDFIPGSSGTSSTLRSMSGRNGSEQSFDSAKYSSGGHLMDTQDYFGGSSPILTIDSSVTFWSPFQTQAQSPSSATSIRPRTASSSRGTVMLKNSESVNEDKRKFLLDLKQTVTGLLLSDLGTQVFGAGSETDAWFGGDLGEECIQRKEDEDRRRRRSLARKKSMKSMKSAKHVATGDLPHLSAGEHSTSSSDATARSGMSAAKRSGILEFPYNMAFRRLLRKFATHPNPFSKLHALFELEKLIIASLSSRSGRHLSRRETTLPTVSQSPTLGSVPELSSRDPAVSTTRAQNLEEAIANCEERRSHSMNQNGPPSPSPMQQHGGGVTAIASDARSIAVLPSTDMIVDVLQGLFRDANIRPKTLFRDLQYIASFVPSRMLDKSAAGKAFWDAGLAALSLKQDVCRVMVEVVDDIVQLNTKNREANAHATAGSTASAAAGGASEKGANDLSASSASLPPQDPIAKFSMADAARMLTITAREGDAAAQRELAILYMTHPDLVPRMVMPLSKPREVFKGEALSARDRKREDPSRADPVTMCVAHHWMEMSKKGGDQLATKYLRTRDEIEKIP
ncbi:hypothetical protein BDY21DRAFT_307227 [Lineolata rhizophorae]|uniref:Uncharacterized protein n=1 Tax=Lineolata rhizophorae TaxID=578093 RepID=A0A6A6NVH9_9PEZI|nr:hypothetical protein BDY21DRAFT_307227 [Lineolata rhizophorae]